MRELDLRDVLDGLPDAVLLVGPEARISYANDAAMGLLGRGRALVGIAIDRLAVDRFRARCARLVAAALRSRRSTMEPLGLVARHLDTGEAIAVEVSARPFADGLVLTLRRAGARSPAATRERERAGRTRMQTQLEVAHALANADSEADALAAVLAAVGRNLAWDVARFWSVDRWARVLRNDAGWRAGAAVPPTSRTFAIGEGGPGRVWGTGEPLWIGDAPEPQELRDESIGLHGVFWFPVRCRGEVCGVLELFSASDRPPHDRLVETMRGLCDQLAQFLERLRVTEQLRASEERTATTLRSIADAVIATDVDGRLTFMNPVAESLTGWGFDEARDRTLAEVFCVVDEDDGRPAADPVARVIRDGLLVGLTGSSAVRSRDGSLHSIEDSGAPIRGEDGAIHGVVLVFRDVTQLRRAGRRRRFLAQATATLSSSIDYAQTLSNVARLAVPRLADWCIVHVVEDERVGAVPLAIAHSSPEKVAWARALQDRNRTTRPGQRAIARVIASGEAELYSDVTEVILAAGTDGQEELRLLRELRARSIMLVPLVAHGRAIGAVTFVAAESAHRYDDADLAMAEELASRAALAIDNARLHTSLRDGEERMRLVLESVGEGIVGVDLRGTVIFANRACADLLGHSSTDDVRGRDIRELVRGVASSIPGAARPGRTTRIDELCLDSTPAHVAEDQLGRADGSTFWAECWSCPIERAGQRVGAVVTFVDVTERRRAREEREHLLHELEEAVHLRDDFLSIASHELRTPLTPLQLHVQGIQRALRRGPTSIAPSDLLGRLDSVARQILRIERLVDNLLDIARIANKRVALQIEEVDLAPLVDEVLARHKEDLVRAGCTPVVSIEVPAVGRWDRLRLDQVISNLLCNAIKFGAGQPIELHVEAGRAAGAVRLVVRDHGIGIRAEDQARIFERFERAVPSRHYGGFGLGLWIVRQIVDAMRGQVSVESVPGEGAAFVVEVPLGQTAAQALAS